MPTYSDRLRAAVAGSTAGGTQGIARRTGESDGRQSKFASAPGLQKMRAGNDWLVSSCRRSAGWVRLVCIPCAGGGASLFRAWEEELPPWIQVSAVQLPGRQNRLREPYFTRMPELVASL